MREKVCSKCRESKPADVDHFTRDRTKPDGLRTQCKACTAKKQRERDQGRAAAADEADEKAVTAAKARAERIASDFDPLKPEDFDVTIGNDGRIDPRAAKEKRQEYSRAMGAHAQALRRAAMDESEGNGDIVSKMPAELGTYLGNLSEQERRFGNRRIARSISLAEAHEVLSLRRFRQAADQYLSAKVEPTGYATQKRSKPAKRSVSLLLSDLHLGSDLSALDSPMPFRAIEEARRLEYVFRQALDYKPQYRNVSELLLLINGDIVEGQLMHDLRDGAPLTEQKVVFWRYFAPAIGFAAQQFPSVRVVCQPGNHGRDLVRHPGRATSRKWDGHEWEMYYALKMMCSELRNVSWQIDFRAVSVVDVHGSKLGLTHGDTEVKLGDPDTKSKENAHTFDRINATRMYGVEFDAWAIGHFHKPRYQPRNPRVVFNGALVPPNGHARTMGYIGEPTGQWLWESVEGYPIGDLRFIEVGPSQDHDEKLGTLIKPFRFEND